MKDRPAQHGKTCLSKKLETKVLLRPPTLRADKESFEEETAESREIDHTTFSKANHCFPSCSSSALNKEPNPFSFQERSTKGYIG